MAKILKVISSARGAASFSTLLADNIVTKIEEKYGTETLITRNLIDPKIPHLDETYLGAFFSPDPEMGEEYKKAVKFSDDCIHELQDADTIVIAVPLYNFGIPSALKAWIDHVARAGKTFQYVDGAPQGLLKNKTVYLAVATGGVYSEGPYKAYDFAEPYLRAVLGFIGLDNIKTFRIEGTAIPALKDEAVAKGLSSIVIE